MKVDVKIFQDLNPFGKLLCRLGIIIYRENVVNTVKNVEEVEYRFLYNYFNPLYWIYFVSIFLFDLFVSIYQSLVYIIKNDPIKGKFTRTKP